VVNDLRVEEEQNRPLPELVESLVQRNRTMARGCEISLKIVERFPPAPLGMVGTEMLRIIQEALTNARRHSGARNVTVSLRVEEGELVAEGFRQRTRVRCGNGARGRSREHARASGSPRQ
jgi:signal transduction histidine kinase